VELGSGGSGRAVRSVRHDGVAARAAQRILMYHQTVIERSGPVRPANVECDDLFPVLR
jgi:hypothetical protein